MQELIKYIATSLVDDGESVRVDLVSEDEQSYELHVAANDRGKVIGRKGRAAHAIRTIMAAACTADGVKPTLDIVD